MRMIGFAKIALAAAIALHASLVVFGNVTDYAINFSFVRNVMMMNTILSSSTTGYRAIKARAPHHACSPDAAVRSLAMNVAARSS